MSEVLVSMERIDKSFPGVHALDQARFELRAGEVHALVGENGAGKSTLLHILGTLDRPDTGTLRIADKELRGMTERNKDDFSRRKEIFFVSSCDVMPCEGDMSGCGCSE